MFLYHVTKKKNLSNIEQQGLVPSVPLDFLTDSKAVYLFESLELLEDALMNWLGDRFEEEDALVILQIDSSKLSGELVRAGYEYLYFDTIPWSAITVHSEV